MHVLQKKDSLLPSGGDPEAKRVMYNIHGKHKLAATKTPKRKPEIVRILVLLYSNLLVL